MISNCKSIIKKKCCIFHPFQITCMRIRTGLFSFGSNVGSILSNKIKNQYLCTFRAFTRLAKYSNTFWMHFRFVLHWDLNLGLLKCDVKRGGCVKDFVPLFDSQIIFLETNLLGFWIKKCSNAFCSRLYKDIKVSNNSLHAYIFLRLVSRLNIRELGKWSQHFCIAKEIYFMLLQVQLNGHMDE